MTKKDHVIQVLDIIKEYRPLANGLKILVSKDSFDDDSITALSEILKNAINQVDDNLKKHKVKEQIQILEKLKSIS